MLAISLSATLAASPAPALRLNPYESHTDTVPRTEIDKLVLARLEQLKIEPANLCSDGVFVRRAYLDVIGTLPSAQEAKDFILDRSPDKRRALIDRLLERDEFADYWAMKWSDLLRVKAEFPINLWPNAAQAYHRWIRTSIRENMPYDQFVRELLTSSGSNFRVGPVNFYRAMQSKDPQTIAQTVALTFMGVRAEKWPEGHADQHGRLLLQGRLQVHRGVEGGNRLLRSGQDEWAGYQLRGARGCGFPGRRHGPARAGPGPARGLRRLAD